MEKPISNADNLYGLVLAGGKSRRMGQDKAMLNLHGKPQLAVCFDLLSRVCERVFVSTREDQKREGFPQIFDQFGNIGPIDGILSALKTYPDKAWLVVGCDLPLIDDATIDYLIAHRNRAKMATAFGSATDGLPEPLCAIYEPVAFDLLRGFVGRGIQCPRKALLNSDFERLPLPDARALENVNTPEQLKEAMKKTVSVQYFAALRESRGTSSESLDTTAATLSDLFDELALPVPRKSLRVAVNDEFVGWDRPLRRGDVVMFIPPTAGG